MNHAEREAHHMATMHRLRSMKIEDRKTKGIDHERTTVRVAALLALEVRSYLATEKGCEALERLLEMTESRDSGQIQSVANFLGAMWGASLLDPIILRGLDSEVGDDCIAVLDAVRWGRLSVSAMVEQANVRVPRTLRAWKLLGPEMGTGTNAP